MDIQLQQVSFAYAKGTPFEKKALFNVDLHVPHQQYTAIIGHTGSGKSTILQHFNGLLKPTEGTVIIGERKITAGEKQKDLKSLRKHVGIVFQFPEHQLFEETVLKDVMFGPLNFGFPEEEARAFAIDKLRLVGLGEEFYEKSPFELSGGQMRRVAIAGVLAMNPDVLVLDEPTAGLDPRGQKEIMDLFYNLHKQMKLTTILVTHSMEHAARYADQVAIMHEGKCVAVGSPREIFADVGMLKQYRLQPPRIVQLQKKYEEVANKTLPKVCLTEEELAKSIAKSILEGREQSC